MPLRGNRLRWPPRPGKKLAAAPTARRQPSSAGQHEDPQRPLAQPNEHDQDAHEQPSAPRPLIKQAFDDVQSGQQDTDCRNQSAQVLDHATKKTKPATGDS